MKHTIRTFVIAAFITAAALTANAEIPVTLVEKISPVDMVFMDMATEAAKASIANNGAPQGVVLILNNTFKSSGSGTDAVLEACKKTGLPVLDGVTVYSVNQPSVKDILYMSQLGVKTIFFVNSKDKVINAGILPESAYDEGTIPPSTKIAELKSIEYPDAQVLF